MKRVVFLASMLAMVLMVGPASAAVVLDFEQGTLVGGTVSSAGVGTNIPVDILKVQVDSNPATFYDLFGNGPNSGGGDSNGSALVNFNTSTGAFTITGGVCVAGNDICNGGTGTLFGTSSTVLATGTGSSANITTQSSTTLVFTEPDTKNS